MSVSTLSSVFHCNRVIEGTLLCSSIIYVVFVFLFISVFTAAFLFMTFPQIQNSFICIFYKSRISNTATPPLMVHLCVSLRLSINHLYLLFLFSFPLTVNRLMRENKNDYIYLFLTIFFFYDVAINW